MFHRRAKPEATVSRADAAKINERVRAQDLAERTQRRRAVGAQKKRSFDNRSFASCLEIAVVIDRREDVSDARLRCDRRKRNTAERRQRRTLNRPTEIRL